MVAMVDLLLFTILTCLLLCDVNAFLKDGTLEQTNFAQNAVTKNEHHSTLMAVKLQSSAIILDIRKKSIARSVLGGSSSEQVVYRNKHLLALFVGNRADCQQARVLCNDLDMKCHQNYGISLSAPRLCLGLADIAQSHSMVASGSRQLAYNALIVNTDTFNRCNTFGDIYKVDVSGNFFRCASVCIGAQSQQLGTWLERNGRNLISHSVNITQPVNSLLELAERCLVENYPTDVLKGDNLSVSITILSDVAGKGRSVLGPYEVPKEVLAQLSRHCDTYHISPEDIHTGPAMHQADIIATGLGTSSTSDACGSYNTCDTTSNIGLINWWNSMFGGVKKTAELSTSCGESGNAGERQRRSDDPVWQRH